MTDKPIIDWDKYLADIKAKDQQIQELEKDKENLRQYASGLENAQNLITVRYRDLEAKNESQAKHIDLLKQCDDSSTETIAKMDDELTRLRKLLNAKV